MNPSLTHGDTFALLQWALPALIVVVGAVVCAAVPVLLWVLPTATAAIQPWRRLKTVAQLSGKQPHRVVRTAYATLRDAHARVATLQKTRPITWRVAACIDPALARDARALDDAVALAEQDMRASAAAELQRRARAREADTLVRQLLLKLKPVQRRRPRTRITRTPCKHGIGTA